MDQLKRQMFTEKQIASNHYMFTIRQMGLSRKTSLLSIKQRKVKKYVFAIRQTRQSQTKNMFTDNQTAASHGKHVYYPSNDTK